MELIKFLRNNISQVLKMISKIQVVNREEAAELLKNLTVADDGTIHHVLKRYRIVFQESSRLLGSPSGTLTVCCFYEPFIVVGNYLEEV
uniref:Uncharacterized protein n=1 Tax=Caenorhabditis japonica TaxID=281687 RepID=A0A8R1IXE0_CAEJA